MSGSSDENKGIMVLAKYLPEPSVTPIWELITQYPLDFQIVNPRKTKLGDFRFKGKRGVPQITVNGDLNIYSFFITTVHELAHFYAFKDFGNGIPAHGAAWKHTYRNLLTPFLQLNFLPKNIEVALVNSLISVKASSCTDPGLYKVLRSYDTNSAIQLPFLDELPQGAKFALQSKVFIKGPLRRKKYECVELNSNKKYLVLGIAQVELLKA